MSAFDEAWSVLKEAIDMIQGADGTFRSPEDHSIYFRQQAQEEIRRAIEAKNAQARAKLQQMQQAPKTTPIPRPGYSGWM